VIVSIVIAALEFCRNRNSSRFPHLINAAVEEPSQIVKRIPRRICQPLWSSKPEIQIDDGALIPAPAGAPDWFLSGSQGDVDL